MRTPLRPSFTALVITGIVALAPSLSGAAAGGQGQYFDWATSVNLGSPINSGQFEQGSAISRDGLSLYFHGRNTDPQGFGGADIWVSRRESEEDAWGEPRHLGSNVNSPANDAAPALSHNGHFLFFHSQRGGGFGQGDLYVSWRQDTQDDLGWEPAQNLGSLVNSSANDQQPYVFEDDDADSVLLFFGSDRAGGLGGFDIYLSELQPDGIFGLATLVPELSSPSHDTGPSIRRDGKEIFLVSNRAGGVGLDDVWVATRENTAEPWSTPVNAGPIVNTPYIENGPELSFDGTTLYVTSPSVGVDQDIYVVTRERFRGR